MTRSSANEALVEFQRTPDAFSAVVTDLTMPHLSGVDLAWRLRAIRSNIPIVLMSGFGDILQQPENQTLRDVHVLAKPFTHDEFAHALRSAVELVCPPP